MKHMKPMKRLLGFPNNLMRLMLFMVHLCTILPI